LDEFFENSDSDNEKKREIKAKRKARFRRLSDSNMVIVSSSEELHPSEYSSPESKKIQCAICAGNHSEERCVQ